VANQVVSVVSDTATLIVHFALRGSSDPAAGGTLAKSPDKPGYEPEDTVQLTAVPAFQYEFIGWTGDLTGTNNPAPVTFDSSKTVVAHFLSVADLIVDNPEATYDGPWTAGTAAPGKYGDYYQYTPTTDGAPTAHSTFTPVIAVPGKYDVFIWYPAAVNRTANAQIFVNFDGGVLGTAIDQTVGGGSWQLIAPELDFAEGTNGYVQLSNDTGEANRLVIADAVRFAHVTPPVIVNSPLNQVVNAGHAAGFSVVAGGTATLNYQWQLNGADVPGATGASYDLAAAQAANAGTYTVVVSNRLGTATSASALLTVIPPAAPTISSVTKLGGGQFRFSFVGESNVTYAIEASTNLIQWTVVTNITSATGTFDFTGSATGAARFFRGKWGP
jgi:hypothetical protein